MSESQSEKVRKVLMDEVELEPYNPVWPNWFAEEREHLYSCLPQGMVGRIEHFGSTAVPSLIAKPIVDMLVEVWNLAETRVRIAPILEAQGYDYFWRPTWGDDTPPFYAWFIKRNASGKRTHHIHMVEPHFEHWDRLLFRDYLISHPETAAEYGRLKLELSTQFPNDRIAYTNGKTNFITRITELAKREARATLKSQFD